MKKIVFSLITLIGLGQVAYADMEDDPLVTMLLVDRLEVLNNSEKTRAWDVSFWAGYDLNKLYLYSSGSATSGGLESSTNELVYSRAISPFWDAQIGVAYDKNKNASQTWAEIALSGLTPYYFETRAALLVNSKGNVGLRLSTEYEMLFTQKFVLTPSLEADFYTKDDPKLKIGSGLSRLEAGLRLRYEFKREFAPYVGVTWERTFGNTRKYNPANETNLMAGVRFWF